MQNRRVFFSAGSLALVACTIAVVTIVTQEGCRGLPISHVRTTNPLIALTFDDGPNPPYTDLILDILERHRVKATFFLLGRNIQMHRNSALKINARGHEIGNHGYSHDPMTWKNAASIETEIIRTDRLIKSLAHQNPPLVRAPFGQWGLGLWRAIRNQHKQLISYSLAPRPADYWRSNPERMYADIMRRVKPGDIIVLHDGEGIRTETALLTEKLVTGLASRGYRFVTLSQLLAEAR